MKPVVRESLKKGIVFAAIGVVLGLAVPPLVPLVVGAMGFAAGSVAAATATSVLGSALVFGGLGALSPGLQSLFGSIFGKGSPENTRQTAPRKGSDSTQIDADPKPSPEQALQAVSGERATTFCQKIDADRTQGKSAVRLSL
jgi:hypothetical protein